MSDIESGPSGSDSEPDINEEESRKLVQQQNRKGKKSGGFQSMGLSHGVFKGIFRRGYKIPTPIQRKCIPKIIDGKDVVAMARTGSGKTAAFLIPILERLKKREQRGPRVVILSPTRELAIQTAKFTNDLSKFCNLSVAVILGGDSLDNQFTQLDQNPDIVIATPGRLLHLLVEMDRRLNYVKMVVFDEADQLFDLGFAEQLNEILGRLPESKQTLLFSATLPNKILEFAKAGLRDPELIRLDVERRLPENLQLTFFHARHEDKIAALLHLLGNVIKADEKIVIFVATKHHVELVKLFLERYNYTPCYIYSSMDPFARKMMISRFRHEDENPDKTTNILITTDIAARGIDIPLLDAVVNFHFAAKAKTFIHRVGRVARAGRPGHAYSIVSNEEMPYLLDLHVFLGRSLGFCKDGDTTWDGKIGRYPQSAIDDEADIVSTAIRESADIQSQIKSAENGYKGFRRHKEKPSSESCTKFKEIDMMTCAVHPIFGDGAAARQSILDKIATLKPKQTIFEYRDKKCKANVSETAYAANVMRTLREKNAEQIEKFKAIKQKKIENTLIAAEKSDDYIPYVRESDAADQHLGINSFQSEAAEALLNKQLEPGQKPKAGRVWDRKRKKFVTNQVEQEKKIKTESGNWIKQSFKTGKYTEYLEKSKAGLLADDSGDEDANQNDMNQSRQNRQNLTNLIHRRTRGGGKKTQAREQGGLKRPEQILKERKERDREMAKQSGRGRGGARGRGGSRGGFGRGGFSGGRGGGRGGSRGRGGRR